MSAQAGYKFSNNWRLYLDVFNVFNAKVNDIDYYYVSRLPGEPAAGVADIHTHPAELVKSVSRFPRGSEVTTILYANKPGVSIYLFAHDLSPFTTWFVMRPLSL